MAAIALLLLAVAVGGASGAQALNVQPSMLALPIVEAGPAGHAVVIAGFRQVGVSFALPGGEFGRLAGSAPSIPTGVVVDAAGETVVVASGAAAQAQTASFGAPLGPPVKLGVANGSAVLVAQDPGGAAAVAWSEGGRLRIAHRSRGSSFSAAVDAGPAISVGGLVIAPDGTVHAIVSRAPGQSPLARYEAILVGLRPGRAQPESLRLDGPEGLALARSSDGRLLAVSRGLGSEGGRLVVQWLDAAGSAITGVHAIATGTSSPLALGAVLEDGGRAVVAWTVTDEVRQPHAAYVAQGDATAGFGPPRRVDRDGELSGALLASNSRGDAILAWGAAGHRPRAILRSAGGRFGAPVIVSPYESGPPTAGVLPDGRVLIGLHESGDATERHVIARLGAGGVETRRVLSEESAVRIKPRARCRAARGRALARTRFAVLRRLSATRREVCSLVTGWATTLHEGAVFLDSVRLAGRFVAYGVFDDGQSVNDAEPEVFVTVQDTRTGRSLPALNSYLGDGDRTIGDLVLAPDGAFAVTLCKVTATEADTYTQADTAQTRRLCGRAGRAVDIVAIDGAGPRGQRTVARGRRIDPRSLRLRGRLVGWHQAGGRRTATLRRLGLPR